MEDFLRIDQRMARWDESRPGTGRAEEAQDVAHRGSSQGKIKMTRGRVMSIL